jgi:hypothetical protein
MCTAIKKASPSASPPPPPAPRLPPPTSTPRRARDGFMKPFSVRNGGFESPVHVTHTAGAIRAGASSGASTPPNLTAMRTGTRQRRDGLHCSRPRALYCHNLTHPENQIKFRTRRRLHVDVDVFLPQHSDFNRFSATNSCQRRQLLGGH